MITDFPLCSCSLQSYVVTHLPFVPKSDLKGQMNQACARITSLGFS